MKNRDALIVGYGINNLEKEGTCIIYGKSDEDVCIYIEYSKGYPASTPSLSSYSYEIAPDWARAEAFIKESSEAACNNLYRSNDT